VSSEHGNGALWQRCRHIVAALEVPRPFDAVVFIDMLAQARGRPIELVPVSARSPMPCGLLVTTDRADCIVYSADTTPLHQQHILLHEAAHIVCHHHNAASAAPDGLAAAQTLLPHLPASLLQRVLGRTVYDEPQEQEAELVASLILYRVTRRGLPRAQPDAPRPRLEALFGPPRSQRATDV
jgi:hypothetical protein